jgi:hypothetical protein
MPLRGGPVMTRRFAIDGIYDDAATEKDEPSRSCP